MKYLVRTLVYIGVCLGNSIGMVFKILYNIIIMFACFGCNDRREAQNNSAKLNDTFSLAETKTFILDSHNKGKIILFHITNGRKHSSIIIEMVNKQEAQRYHPCFHSEIDNIPVEIILDTCNFYKRFPSSSTVKNNLLQPNETYNFSHQKKSKYVKLNIKNKVILINDSLIFSKK